MKRTISLMLALMLAVSLLAGCGGDPGTSTQPGAASSVGMTDIKDVQTDTKADATKTYKKDIKIALIGGLATFNPQGTSNTVHDVVHKMTFNQLVSLNDSTAEIEAELAESWEVESSSSYLFKLRKGVKFSNGEELTSDDVVFTFRELPSLTGETTAAATVLNSIDTVTAIDEHTVRITLNKADADFLYRMYLPAYSIFNREACEADLAAGVRTGTGGWIVTELAAGDHISYKRFDDSWVWEESGVSPTETITFTVRAETAARAIAVQTGEVAAAFQLTLSDVDTLKGDSRVETLTFASENLDFFFFNLSDGMFADDKNLQYAVAYALDFDSCNLLQNNGMAERAYTMWGKNQYGYYDGYEHLEHNLEKAKEYMAKSKYPNGCDIKLVFHNTKHANVAALVQEQLKKIGVNASIIETDLAGMRTMLQGEPGLYDCGLSAISLQAIGDRFHFIGQVGSATNRAKYYDDYIQGLYDKALAESDDAARKAIYKEIQEIILEDKPYVPMYYGVEAVAWHTGVSGVIWSADAKPDFTHIMWEQ